jgi:hypothetical protein
MNRPLPRLRLAVVALAILSVHCGAAQSQSSSGVTFQAMQPVDAPLAEKAQNSCWFKVKNRSGRSEEMRQWASVSSSGAKTERLGDLLIVTGAMDPPVHDDHFYGCSLFEYTQGSPVVMTTTTSPRPVAIDRLIPFGFSPDGTKQQR